MRILGFEEQSAGALPGPGARVEDFEIEEEIGRGGMGVVYRARQVSLDRRVALKLVPHGLEGLGSKWLERREREGKLLASLRHPAIVAVHGAGTAPGFYWVAMDHVEGSTLGELLTTGTEGLPRPGDEAWLPFALPLLHLVAGALATAHAAGIVHRDVKPGNVLIDGEGRPFLADFGLARPNESTGDTVTRGFVGTPRFASPEQCRGEALSVRSDVFSFGALAFETVTGSRAFDGETDPGVLERIRLDDPAWRGPGAMPPRDLRAVIEKCLEKRERERYADAGEVEAEFGRLLRFEPVRARPRGIVSRRWRRMARRPLRPLATGALLLVLVTVAFASWLLQSQGRDLERGALRARFEEADQLFHAGSYEECEAALEGLLADDDAPAEAFGLHGDLMIWTDRDREAEASYLRAVDRGEPGPAEYAGLALAREDHSPEQLPDPRPESARDHALHAIVHVRAEEHDEALEHLDLAVALRPRSFPFRISRAQQHRRMFHWKEAAEDYRLGLAIRPALPEVVIAFANVLMPLEEREEAVRYVRRSLLLHPRNARLMAELGLRLGPGDEVRSEALESARAAARLAPDDWRVERTLGLVLIQYDELDEARSLLEAQYEKDSDDPGLLLALARLERKAGSPAPAEAYARRAVEIGKGTGRLYALGFLAEILSTLDSEEGNAEALEIYTHLVELDPQRIKWSGWAARLSVEMENYEAASAFFARACEPLPGEQSNDRAYLLASWGSMLRHEKKYPEALLAFERAHALRPDWCYPPHQIAQIWFDLAIDREMPSYLDAAMIYVEVALELPPEWEGPWILKGAIEKAQGLIEASELSYLKAIEVNSTTRARIDLSDTLFQLGRDAEALAAARQALEEHPELASAWCMEGEVLLESRDPAVHDPARALPLLEKAVEFASYQEEFVPFLPGYVALRDKARALVAGSVK